MSSLEKGTNVMPDKTVIVVGDGDTGNTATAIAAEQLRDRGITIVNASQMTGEELNSLKKDTSLLVEPVKKYEDNGTVLIDSYNGVTLDDLKSRYLPAKNNKEKMAGQGKHQCNRIRHTRKYKQNKRKK